MELLRQLVQCWTLIFYYYSRLASIVYPDLPQSGFELLLGELVNALLGGAFFEVLVHNFNVAGLSLPGTDILINHLQRQVLRRTPLACGCEC